MTPEKLRSIVEDLGPTFVKLGQIMSMRRDMLPEAYCRELEKLRAEVRPLAFEEARGVVETEYGVSLRSVFDVFDETPIGSASIAQVHAARLKNGAPVVVKVQRPGYPGHDGAGYRAAAPGSRASRRDRRIGQCRGFPHGAG